ncbi:hypothetical protein HON22_06220 [Candidatus Peregrinibacteria bacterium]|jgi:hypothetical protein|nr:hypothetical protein [Candidatus Peregrinibacteria bacterium]
MTFQQKLIIFIGTTSILLMLFFLSQSLYRSYLLESQLNKFKQRNENIIENIDEIQGQVGYFNSERYKDKHAKEMLNKLQEGEKVIILSGTQENILIPESEILGEIPKQNMSIEEEWKVYFFGKDTLEKRMK